MKLLILTGLLSLVFSYAHAQADIIAQIESTHKECLHIKLDSIACSRNYMIQADSMLVIIFDKVKAEVSSDDKAELLKEQFSWNTKRGTYFKKQDENFAYNIKEGTWKKEMIRFVYEDKAAFVMKRIKTLLKRLNE